MLKFYHVKESFIKEEGPYSFPLFFTGSNTETRIVFLHQNTPLTLENRETLKSWQEKGGTLQIFHEHLNLFMQETQTEFEDIYAVNKVSLTCIDLELSRKKKYLEVSSQKYILRELLVRAIKTNDFKPLLNIVFAKVMMFKLSESLEVSFVTQLVGEVFLKDIISTRIAAVSFLLALELKITATSSLTSLLIASLLKDVGLGQIDFSLLTEFENLKSQDEYLKHPMLSLYVLSKSELELEALTKRIILEHHEIFDGSGFPRQKKDDHIHLLSEILGTVDFMFQSLEGSFGNEAGEFGPLIKAMVNEVPFKGRKMILEPKIKDFFIGLDQLEVDL